MGEGDQGRRAGDGEVRPAPEWRGAVALRALPLLAASRADVAGRNADSTRSRMTPRRTSAPPNIFPSTVPGIFQLAILDSYNRLS